MSAKAYEPMTEVALMCSRRCLHHLCEELQRRLPRRRTDAATEDHVGGNGPHRTGGMTAAEDAHCNIIYSIYDPI